MEYQYKVIISNRTIYKEFEIQPDMDKVKLGTGSSCEFRLNPENFFSELEIEFRKEGKKWVLECSDEIYISKGDMRKLLSTDIAHGDVLSIRYASTGNEVFELRFLIDFEAKIPFYNWYVELGNTMDIATDATADLILKSRFSNNSKIRLTASGNTYLLEEIVSEYGVYLNGRKMQQKTALKDCDFFSVAEFHFYYRDRKIYFDRENLEVANGAIKELSVQSNTLKYPLFNRNTRIQKRIATDTIEIIDAPEIPKKPEQNIVMTLLPSLVMFGLVIVVRGFMSTSTGSYVIMSICTMALGIMTTIAGFINGSKKYKRECAERQKKYTEYIEKKKYEISKARQEELESLRTEFCDIDEDVKIVENFDKRLFERVKDSEDFLNIYLGEGTVHSKQKIEYRKSERLEVGDELTNMPEKLNELFSNIEEAPICMDAHNSDVIGVVGKDEELYGLLKNTIVDIATRHYYEDVKLYLLVDDFSEYEWVRMLPHVVSANGTRNIVFDNESKNNIFENLFRELTRREQSQIIPYHIVVLVKKEFGIKNHPISRYMGMASELGVTFIFFENTLEETPLHCNQIIRLLSETEGEICKTDNGNQIQQFSYHVISDEQAYAVVTKLAPVYCEKISLENSLTKNITLFELLKIFAVGDLNLQRRWSESKIYKSMAAPLGVNAKNEVVCLNLHEKAHGPHGLVAGTTGSGKSEILQSYILSAATIFHPYEIGFVIIDFKGGGMVNQFRNLPHLIGAITNIDGNEINRSLLSIKAELRKRQTLFAESGVNHIDAYIKKYKKGEVSIPLPHLVLIVDEFAELKMDQPDFMKELISAARIGRSLGVHLILATQKPSGVVDAQIWSNSKFKLCLKVQNKEDSNEVLKTPLAAEIKEPGRAYLQVGNNEIFELFQSAYSGASAEMTDASEQKSFQIFEVEHSGKILEVYKKKKKKDTDGGKNQLEAIVDYIADYCKANQIERLPGICLPPLEECIAYESKNEHKNGQEIVVPLGIYDDPNNQKQDTVYLNLSAGHTVIIGSSQYGKTNLLQTIIRGIMEDYTSEEVNIYIYDFASMALKVFENSRHVGGVMIAADDEKMKNSMRMFAAEIRERKAVLASLGITSFSAYLEAGYTDMPQIVMIIDNFLALRELYSEYEDILLNILREGIAVGISVIVTSLQTNGINYRFISNFSNKIALYCNQKEEYGTLFDRCRMSPKGVPGRGLVEIEKEVFEYQTYMAFEGQREIDRVNEIRAFIEKCNQEVTSKPAKKVPEVPKVVDRAYVKENYKPKGDYIIPVGVDYETVEWNCINLLKTATIGMIGREHFGKTNLLRGILKTLQRAVFDYETEVYLIDDYEKQLEEFSGMGIVKQYSTELTDFATYLDIFEEELARRKEKVQENGIKVLKEEPLLLLVVQNKDIYSADGVTKNQVEQYKKIVKQYKQFKVCFIFADVLNAPAAFSAPEMLKASKEYETFMICDDLANVKLIDFNAATLKQYKKQIELGDSFLVTAGVVKKQKNIYEEA